MNAKAMAMPVLFVGLLVLLTPPIAIWAGFVVQTLWGWFAVPLGLPVLSLVHAIGVALLMSILTKTYPTWKRKDDSWERVTEDLAAIVVRPAFALLLGWILTVWMP